MTTSVAVRVDGSHEPRRWRVALYRHLKSRRKTRIASFGNEQTCLVTAATVNSGRCAAFIIFRAAERWYSTCVNSARACDNTAAQTADTARELATMARNARGRARGALLTRGSMASGVGVAACAALSKRAERTCW